MGLAAACVLAVGPAAAGWATSLDAVRTEETPDGATVALSLSDGVDPTVATVEAPGGGIARIYVDLPRGTRLASGLERVSAGAGPVTATRIGLGDGEVVRVVLDLAGAAGWRLERRAGGREIVVAVASGDARPPERVPPAPVARRRGAAGRRAAQMRPRIVLDPGHGGRDPGAQGYVVEKQVTLDIAKRVARLLRERLRAEVVLTRADDATLALSDRTARANRESADLFVSIHANADPHAQRQGIETYVLDNGGDHATMRLAAMENGLDPTASFKGKTDVRYILSDLVQVGKMDESLALATALQGSVVRQLRRRWPGVTDLGVKRGPFYVLVGAHMPCVLVETAFLTHPVEGRRLQRGRVPAGDRRGAVPGHPHVSGGRGAAEDTLVGSVSLLVPGAAVGYARAVAPPS